jgi:hypothetical protein
MRHYLHLYRQLRRKGWTREAAHRRAKSHALVMETLELREAAQ